MASPAPKLARRAGSELAGTLLLLAAIVGSGIMGGRLAGGNEALALLANTVTASTSFANPAVTLARAMTDTFAGIRPVDVPAFVAAQCAGAAAATLLFRWLLPSCTVRAPDLVQSHGTTS